MGATAQGRESRQRRRAMLAVGTGVVLVMVTAAAVWVFGRRATPAAGEPRPSLSVATPSKAPRVAKVTYEVSGEGRMDIQYTDPAKAETVSLLNQPVPWRVDLAPHAVSFVQITARRTRNSSDEHRVRALINGAEVCSGTDVGGYMKSTCSELVPPL